MGMPFFPCKGTVAVPLRHNEISALLSGGSQPLGTTSSCLVKFLDLFTTCYSREISKGKPQVHGLLSGRESSPGVLSPNLTHKVLVRLERGFHSSRRSKPELCFMQVASWTPDWRCGSMVEHLPRKHAQGSKFHPQHLQHKRQKVRAA